MDLNSFLKIATTILTILQFILDKLPDVAKNGESA